MRLYGVSELIFDYLSLTIDFQVQHKAKA
jgi:hypothetical protein